MDYSEYVKMVEFFCGELLTPEEMRRLTVNVSFERGNPDHVNKKGETFEEDTDEYCIWIRPTMSIKEQVLTLAHECVHVKQFMRKQMCPTTGDVLCVVLKQLENAENEYWDNPTEIEAYGRAPGLIHMYRQKCS